jgi:hypothetical protein
MAEVGRLTKDEWDRLEPLLSEADNAVHAHFIASPAAHALLGSSDKSPGYLLLQRLKELNDEAAIKLFRATEMYHHEITRADITAAYLEGKRAGRARCCAKGPVGQPSADLSPAAWAEGEGGAPPCTGGDRRPRPTRGQE